MGRHRKIPGRKHRGVKDPEVQRAKREEAIKTKINSLPKVLDDQEVPKKLQLLMKGKEDAKQKLIEKRLRRKEVLERKNDPEAINDTIRKNEEKKLLDSSKHMGVEMRLPGMVRPLKSVPVFKQEPGESQRRFFNRMETTVQAFLKQRNYEARYNIDLIQDPNTGKTSFVDRPKDELEDELSQKKREKLAKKGIVVRTKEEKRQIRRQKEKERKMKKKRKRGSAREDDFEAIKDQFKPAFNEVAHQPPSLKLPRGVTLSTEARRPGSSLKLLLLDKLKKNDASSKVAAKKKKSDEMSLATKERMRIERERVIKEYRKLKQKNFHF